MEAVGIELRTHVVSCNWQAGVLTTAPQSLTIKKMFVIGFRLFPERSRKILRKLHLSKGRSKSVLQMHFLRKILAKV